MMCKDMRDGSCSNGNIIILEKYGNGSKSIGYGRSGNVRLTGKIILNSQRAECCAIKEHRRSTRLFTVGMNTRQDLYKSHLL